MTSFNCEPLESRCDQTLAWSNQSLRYIKSTIDSKTNDEFNHFLHHFPKNINPAKILDVGCGGGAGLGQWFQLLTAVLE